jgi:hypothetical protein
MTVISILCTQLSDTLMKGSMNRPTDREIFDYVHFLITDVVKDDFTKRVCSNNGWLYAKLLSICCKLIRFVLVDPTWKYANADKELNEDKN